MTPTVEKILNAIETNTRDGATALAALALDAFEAAADAFPAEPGEAEAAMRKLVGRIQGLRPAMAAIGVQAERARSRAEQLVEAGVREWSQAILEAVRIERTQLTAADERIAAFTESLIGTGRRVVTCSFSGTVHKTLVALEPSETIIGEGHPLGDGLRSAEHLASMGLNVTVVPDGALATFVRDADAVVVGADQVLMDGSVVNRASTLTLALAAAHYAVPVYVVCHSIKFSGLPSAAGLSEVCPDAFPPLPASIQRNAPVFDTTPAGLIHRIVTETGAHPPSTQRS